MRRNSTRSRLTGQAVPVDGLGEGLVDVVVEIPKGSRNKYEFDEALGAIRLDRRLFSATVYPADYGFLPETLGEDGDPLDALVLLEDGTFPGCWVTGRPLGVLWMADEKGPDAKIICVPPWDTRYAAITELDQLPIELREEIQHFFDVYKLIEPEKESSTRGYGGRDEAWAEIEASRVRYRG
jgi:inorganic pyrophosphatase